jgi:hypothetical protein
MKLLEISRLKNGKIGPGILIQAQDMDLAYIDSPDAEGILIKRGCQPVAYEDGQDHTA